MTTGLLLFALTGFAVMAALPAVFFRRGRLSFGWLATAAPFFVDATWLIGALAGLVPMEEAAFPARAALATGAIAASFALIAWTVHTHRVAPARRAGNSAPERSRHEGARPDSRAPALWHQADDEPAALVTHGPYARVRHPFYAAFCLLLLGTALLVVHPVTLAMLVLGVVQLRRTARREEVRLAASRFGADYRRYMQRTGRLVPRL